MKITAVTQRNREIARPDEESVDPRNTGDLHRVAHRLRRLKLGDDGAKQLRRVALLLALLLMADAIPLAEAFDGDDGIAHVEEGQITSAKLRSMRRTVLGLGSAQVAVTLLVVMGVSLLLGLSWQRALVLGEPDLFFTTPGSEGSPLVMLRLVAVNVERLAELVTDAWRMRAPAELVADLDEDRQVGRGGAA